VEQPVRCVLERAVQRGAVRALDLTSDLDAMTAAVSDFFGAAQQHL
jgi:hypothetical protein